MHFSVSSLLNVTILSGISVLFLWLMLRHQYFINHLSFAFAFFCLGLLFLRIFIPMEYVFTWSIYDQKILPVIRRTFLYELFTWNGWTFNVSHLLLFLWITGSLVVLFYQLYQYIKFYHFAKSLPAVQDSRTERILNEILCTQKKKKHFQVVQTEQIHSPMIVKFQKYYILMPDISLSDKEFTYILKHEITHAYHGDLVLKALVNFLCILYWWNPFVYLLHIEMDKLLEFRADYFITKNMGPSERVEYLECLLHIVKEQYPYRSVPATLSFVGRKNFALTQRFSFVLQQRTKVANFLSVAILFPFLVMIICSYCIIFEPTSPMPPEDAEGLLNLTPETSYLIRTSNNSYDLYLEGEYITTIDTADIGIELPIYESKDDVP